MHHFCVACGIELLVGEVVPPGLQSPSTPPVNMRNACRRAAQTYRHVQKRSKKQTNANKHTVKHAHTNTLSFTLYHHTTLSTCTHYLATTAPSRTKMQPTGTSPIRSATSASTSANFMNEISSSSIFVCQKGKDAEMIVHYSGRVSHI